MISALIIDDEVLAREHILRLLQKHNDIITVSATACDGAEAVQKIIDYSPQVVFLDIHLPDFNGFEVLDRIEGQLPYVIFTTAYDRYALQAFETLAVDYLVKPIDQWRFDKAIEKLMLMQGHLSSTKEDIVKIKNNYTAKSQRNFEINSLALQSGNKTILLDLKHISFLEADDKYVNVYSSDGKKYLSDKSLTVLSEILPPYFLRMHRSYIVNINYIVEIHKYFKGRFIFVLKDSSHSRLQSSESYREEIKKVLQL